MKRRFLAAVAAIGTSAVALPAAGADAKTVAFFEETCGACHGPAGEGTPGLAPALKGNKFVLGASPADIAAVVTNGRAGDQKHYKDLPSPMPAHSLSEKKLDAVVSYVKGELQAK